MNHKIIDHSDKEAITDLFTSVFTVSEGEQEGQLVGELSSELTASTDNEDVIGVGVYDKGSIVGVIFFTRLQFKEPVKVYLLAPVAVRTSYQQRGVGQALINYGLSELKSRSVDIVITYGAPTFYSKVGFQALSEKIIKAPLKFSMPEGWLGQSLTEQPISTMSERPVCVKAFNKPALW